MLREVFEEQINFWDRYILSKLIDLGVTAVHGNKIYNSDEKVLYPDYLGLYDVQTQLLTREEFLRPLSVSVFSVHDEDDYKERIVPVLDPDLRWPTEIMIVFDRFNFIGAGAKHFFYYTLDKRQCWMLRNKGIVKVHDQVGIYHIMTQIIKTFHSYCFLGKTSNSRKDKLLKGFMDIALEMIFGYIIDDKPMDLDEFLSGLNLNRVDGKFLNKLKMARQKYQSIFRRKRLYGKQ